MTRGGQLKMVSIEARPPDQQKCNAVSLNDQRLSVERGLLPDWVLGTYLPIAVIDGKRGVKMLPIRELRERLVSTTMRVVGRSIAVGGSEMIGSIRDVPVIFDRHCFENPISLASAVESKAGLPVVALPNFREWVNFRFSLSAETFSLGTNILVYCEKMSQDASVEYGSMKSSELNNFRIKAGSGDIAYFSAWVMKNIWEVPTYLISGKFPEEKIFCVANVAGMWNLIRKRNVDGYVVDMNYETISGVIESLGGVRDTMISEVARELVWQVYKEGAHEDISS